jgi:hypothetical protein
MSTSSLDQLELQLEELEASADPHAAEQKFSAPAGASRIRTLGPTPSLAGRHTARTE